MTIFISDGLIILKIGWKNIMKALFDQLKIEDHLNSLIMKLV